MIVAGLGNPGREYGLNRHNVGFLFLDHLVAKAGPAAASFRFKSSFDAEVGECRVGGERVWLVKPQSYMNLSGGPVSRVAGFYKSKPQDIVVVYDDVALPFGSLRVRPGGSAGGHKGMLSIAGELGTESFPRIRIGIHSDARIRSLAGFVLANFDSAEREALPEIFDRCAEALELVVRGDMNTAMAKFNKKNPAAGEAPAEPRTDKQR